MKKFFILALFMVALLVMTGNPLHAALTPGATYTITIQKVNSNGTVTDFSTTTGLADSNGKLSFSLTNMPTTNDANFIVFIIKDSGGNIVRKGFAPAPPPGSTNLVGVNTLSTAQTNAILAAGTTIGSDDPIAVAYLITLLRSPSATANDATLLAALGAEAITGNTGFEGYLTSHGVTAAQMAAFKSKLIYNGTAGKKTIADMMAGFKVAVDSNNATTADQEMQKAGGMMAEVFMDAAEAAGIDFTQLLAAHDAAGDVSESGQNPARMSQLTPSVKQSLNQSMESFFKRIATVKVKSEYTKALTALNASGTQVDSFNAAVTAMMTATSAIDSDYSAYFSDPAGYIAAHNTTEQAVRTAIDAAFTAAFSAFQDGITSSNADITTLKSNVAAAFLGNANLANQLPSDFGTYRDFSGATKNWPIPQVVMMNWIAQITQLGGSIAYTRDTTPVPAMMAWLGSCDVTNPPVYDAGSCAARLGNWTPLSRHNYTTTYQTPSAAFNAYLGLQEDLQIIEMTRYSIYQGGQPTRQQEKDAKTTFKTNMDNLGNNISGTTNGTTAISSAQKNAVVKLLMQPSMD